MIKQEHDLGFVNDVSHTPTQSNREVPQEEIFLKEEPNDSDSSIDVSVPMPE